MASRPRRTATPTEQPPDPGLVAIGLAPGHAVRFRRGTGTRWLNGTVTAREADGSVALRDERGRARSIPLEQIEVRCTGPRGGRGWEPATERARRAEQLPLFPAAAPPPGPS